MVEKSPSYLSVPSNGELEQAEDMRKGMSEQELMEAWAETGDRRYLTPQLMERMGMKFDERGEIFFANDRSDQELDEDVLRTLGVNSAVLQRRPAREVARILLPLASKQVSFANPHEQAYTEDERDVVRRELSRFLRERPREMMKALFEMLSPENVEVLRYIRHLEDEVQRTARWLESSTQANGPGEHLTRDFESILMAAMHEAEKCKARLWRDQHGKYLVFQAIQDFCSRLLLTRGDKEDADLYVPFEITKGRYAAFSLDGNRIFVAEEHQSERIAELFQRGWTPDYKQHGHDAPNYKLDYFDEELLDEWESIIDSGTLISDLFPSEFAKNPDLILDFATLLHGRFRAIIEEDLGFRLRDLTIREQLFFLRFAKNIQWHQRDQLKSFVTEWGILGLRVLLATAVDEKVGDEIIALGRWGERNDKALVERAFAKFCKITERIDSLEEYIRTTFGKDDPDLASEVTEKTLLRARKLIGEAHAAAERGSLDMMLSDIEKLDVGAKLLVDVCRSLNDRGELDPTQISGSQFVTVLGGSFKGVLRRVAEQMETIQREQYGTQGARYSEENPELYAALNDALRERIENPESNTRFQIFLHSERVVGFFRLDEKQEHGKVVRMHLASVMGDPDFQGGKIIESLLDKKLKEITVPVYAECDPNSAITSVYLRRMGFVATAVDVEKNKTIFRIERPVHAQEVLAHPITVEHVRERAKTGSTESPGRIAYRVCDGPADVKDDLARGAVLTHWEQDPVTKKTDRKFYARLRFPARATE